jgi:hypothetical protein
LNLLYVNRRDGAFADEAMERGAALNGAGKAQAGMGVAVGDADGDGEIDLFVTNLAAIQLPLVGVVSARVHDSTCILTRHLPLQYDGVRSRFPGRRSSGGKEVQGGHSPVPDPGRPDR